MDRPGVYGLALGYEDLNDHEDLKSDPLLALGKGDVEGRPRHRSADPGKVPASSSTLSRLDLTPADADAHGGTFIAPGGLSGGSNGSIIDHKSSGNSARAIRSSLQPGCILTRYTIHRQ